MQTDASQPASVTGLDDGHLARCRLAVTKNRALRGVPSMYGGMLELIIPTQHHQQGTAASIQQQSLQCHAELSSGPQYLRLTYMSDPMLLSFARTS